MPGISFDRAVEYYDETRGFAPGVGDKVRDAVVTFTKVPHSARFLELGVGTGRIAQPFIEAGYSYDGVDISTAMMARLGEKLRASDQPGASYHYGLAQADITKWLPFADGVFDVAIMVHILHLVDDWQAALLQTRRVLRPSGSWILIARADGQGVSHTATLDKPVIFGEDTEPKTARSVRAKWNEILRSLGQERNAFRPGSKLMDDSIVAFLRDMGAAIQVVDLVEYVQPGVSPREMAQRLKARMYSGDWNLPDDIHAEAVRRLDQWLSEECPNADEAGTQTGTFSALVASW